MEKEKKPDQPQEQEQQPFTGFVPLGSRDQLIAELKAKFPGITDEELEAFGA